MSFLSCFLFLRKVLAVILLLNVICFFVKFHGVYQNKLDYTSKKCSPFISFFFFSFFFFVRKPAG